MRLIKQNGSHTHSLGRVPQETDYEMDMYAQEVEWEGPLETEGIRIVQREKLNYNTVAIVNLHWANRTSLVAGVAL